MKKINLSNGRKRWTLVTSTLLAALWLAVITESPRAQAAQAPGKPIAPTLPPSATEVAPIPDLVPRSWRITPPCDKPWYECEPIQLGVALKNQGFGPAKGPITIDVRPAGSAQAIFTLQVNPLPSGGEIPRGEQILIGYGTILPTPPGFPRLPFIISVDTKNWVKEINETNNISTVGMDFFIPLIPPPGKQIPVVRFCKELRQRVEAAYARAGLGQRAQAAGIRAENKCTGGS